MKRFLLVAAILVSGLTIFAQDIIVTKEAKRIDAKVLEINIDNVKYKDFQNQDGPIYTILKSDIASIMYQNGKVETFANPTTQSDVQPTQQLNMQGNPQNLTAKQFDDMDDDNIDEYLRKYEGGKIYETFHSGMNLRSTGKKLLTAGLVLSGVGLASSIASIFMVAFGDFDNPNLITVMYYGGCAMFTIGQGLTIASIPISAVGGSKKKIAKNEYIDKYLNGGRTAYTPVLNLNYTGNGVGLVLKF